MNESVDYRTSDIRNLTVITCIINWNIKSSLTHVSSSAKGFKLLQNRTLGAVKIISIWQQIFTQNSDYSGINPFQRKVFLTFLLVAKKAQDLNDVWQYCLRTKTGINFVSGHVS